MLNSTELQSLLEELFPINRSITGAGNRETLEVLKSVIPELKLKSVRSGSKAFDWKIPQEWEVKEAYIQSMSGNIIVNFAENNLHLMQYSESFEGIIRREDLFKHLYTSEKFPEAIPYVTAYYDQTWGFCVSENFKKTMRDDFYKVVIKSRKFKGKMDYGELVIKGKSTKEVLLSTYICHPSMANNELSGPLVSLSLAKEISSLLGKHNYTYRFLFIPETIGAIYYLSRNLRKLKKRVVSGLVLTCLGDDRSWSYLESRNGNCLIDKVTLYAFQQAKLNYIQYSYLDRGSDERQFSSPRVNLPIASVMRSKYGTYPEYHTSADNLNLVNGRNLQESANFIYKLLSILDRNIKPKAKIFCEPMLSKRNLRENKFQNTHLSKTDKLISDVLAYCDGVNDVIDISQIVESDFDSVNEVIQMLKQQNLVDESLY